MTDRLGSALRQLRGGVLPVLDEPDERARRERIAARVHELSRELAQQRQRRRRFAFGLAAAALVGAFVAVVYVGAFDRPAPLAVGAASELELLAGQVSVRGPAGLSTLAAGQLELPDDALLVTRPEQSAELRLPSQTALSVAAASEVGVRRRQARVDAFEERVLLRSGGVALRVPKLGNRGTVAVETRDAVIEVHGTQFSVKLVERPPLEPFTEVVVQEGRVLVRSGAAPRFLGAGERWSSDETSRPAPSPNLEPAPSAAAEPPSEPPASAEPRRRSQKAGRVSPPSELAAQNRLLEAAELARKQGLHELALSRLETLIARYSDAELAQNARVERFRVLHEMGRDADAVGAAREYLGHHPRGYARAEAQHLIEQRAPARAP